MRYWPETATAVAVRATEAGAIEIAAPFGLDDLFALIVRPTPYFIRAGKREIYRERLCRKHWLMAWPRLRCEMDDP